MLAFLRHVKHLILGVLGVSLGARNLFRAFLKGRKRGLFSRMEASFDRVSGICLMFFGFIYLIIAFFIDGKAQVEMTVKEGPVDEEEKEEEEEEEA